MYFFLPLPCCTKILPALAATVAPGVYYLRVQIDGKTAALPMVKQ